MENSDFKILLVDDEQDIIEFISYNLKKEGFQVFSACNGKEAVEKAVSIVPHLILMDVMMPILDGVEACKEIRTIQSLKDTLIVFLSARAEDYTQIAALNMGGDEYITKPIKPNVLNSNIKAKLRRFNQKNTDTKIIKVDNITIDKEKYIVIKDNEEIILPKKEFELLALLASKPNKVFTREEIFSKVWGDNVIVGDRTIDVHVRKIREKLDSDNIKTVKGVGYKFEVLL